MQFDLPLDELERYRPDVVEPADFDDFWASTLAGLAGDAQPIFEPVESGLRTVDVLDVRFRGHGDDPVAAWLVLPRHRPEPLPVVVEFVGYGGGRGLPHEWLFWSAAGFAHLVMDTRGQGSEWRVSDTADAGDTGGPAAPGFLTRGIASRETYYYRRLYVDAVRAVAAARSHPDVDAARTVVAGHSQGGGVALAAAALVPDLAAALIDVPFLCHFRRALEVTDERPYAELARYCSSHRDVVDDVFATLGYFDGVNLAKRATAPALFSVGLTDTVCPPSTVFAARNWYAGASDIAVYQYNGHEGGDGHHRDVQLAFLADHVDR